MKNDAERRCPVCNCRISGRSDKKFCSDSCRAFYNNIKYRTDNGHIRRVNRILKHNYNIIKEIYASGKTTADLYDLLRSGFDFRYMTTFERNGKRTSIGCYEYRYSLCPRGKVNIEKHLPEN